MVDQSYNELHNAVSGQLLSRFNRVSAMRGPGQFYPASPPKLHIEELGNKYKPQWGARRWKFYDVFDTLWDDYQEGRQAEFMDFVPYYLSYYSPDRYNKVKPPPPAYKESPEWHRVHNPAYDRSWWRPVRPTYQGANNLDHALMMHRHGMLDYGTLDAFYFTRPEARAKKLWSTVWPKVNCSN